MQVTERKRLFTYIPVEYERILQDEVLSLYEIFAQDVNVPCLDGAIINRLGFYHMAICYFYDHHGAMIDDDWIVNEINWEQLNRTYPIEKTAHEFLALRSDIKNYLLTEGLFFEEMWVYSNVVPDECVTEIRNAPLQSVW